MEEKNDKLEPINNKSMSKELKKIHDMQKEVLNMRSHISYLLKEENRQQKKMNHVYHNSIKLTNNKINHVSTHLCQKERAENRFNQYVQKHGAVKEMRQKQIDDLRQTRLEVSNMKQKQTQKVRELSKQNDKIIRSIKETYKENNMSKASQAKLITQQKREQFKAQQQQIKREIEERALKEKIRRINQKPVLEKRLEIMKKQSEQIQLRIKRKQDLQSQIKQTAKKITKMHDEEIIDLAKTCRNKIHQSRIHSESPKQIQQPQKKQNLFMRALEQDLSRIR